MPFHKTINFLMKLAVLFVPMWLYFFFCLPPTGSPLLWMVLYGVMLLTLSMSFGCYRIGMYRVRTLLWSFCVALIVVNFLSAIQVWLIYDQLPWLSHIMLTIGQGMLAACMYVVVNYLYFKISPQRTLLGIRGSSENDERITTYFGTLHERFTLVQTLQDDVDEATLMKAIDEVSAVLISDIDLSLRDRLVSHCFEQDKRLFVVPNMRDVLLHESHLTQVGDTTIFLCKNRGMTREQAIAKRTLDLFGSFFGLLLLSPLLLITALLIKLDSPGPVFYCQTRVTKGGRRFRLVKFRSMTVDAERDGKAVLCAEGDKRVTKVGKVIRRVRIDELPQLWNVLRGQMSLVGPRPERPEIMEEYIEEVPFFGYRLKVKAGLTGYAQVFGRYNTPFEEKVKMDVLYIARYSLLLDIQLLLSTVRILFMKDSTQGVEKDQSSDDEPGVA